MVPFDDGATAVQNLLAGKVDCVVIDKAPAQEYVKANAGLTILDTEYANEDYAIGMAKDNTALQEALNKALAELKASTSIFPRSNRIQNANHVKGGQLPPFARRKKEVSTWVIGRSFTPT